MKKLIALLFITGQVQAATTGTLVLQGVVNANFDLIIAPQTGHNTLNITGGETNKLIGIATEKSNNPGGYKVTVSSANNGQLKNGSIDFVSYQISYNGGTNLTPTTTPTTVKTVILPAPAGNLSNINVTFPAKPLALAGTYSDTLTFSIEAP